MRRKTLTKSNKISYLDNEKDGQALVCLHGHFGCASMFTFLENEYSGRLILIDQRGHGYSDHCQTYRTDDYINDLKEVLQVERVANPIILGHSLGGVNAYHYASKYGNVKALIIEDIGTQVNCSNEFIKNLPNEFNSLYDIEVAFEKIDMKLDQYFLESISYDGLHWKFLFDYDGMVISQKEMNGIHWKYWDDLSCPVLLMHGTKSWACETKNIKEMKKRNKNTFLKIFDGVGHTIRDERRTEYIATIKEFLKQIESD